MTPTRMLQTPLSGLSKVTWIERDRKLAGDIKSLRLKADHVRGNAISKWRVSFKETSCGMWSRYNGGHPIWRDTQYGNSGVITEFIILWFSSSKAEDWLYTCAVRCDLHCVRRRWKNVIAATDFSLSASRVFQSCGTSSPTTSRTSRWTKATRPSSSATSPRASPRPRSATASSRSGWRRPKVLPSRFDSFPSSLPTSLLILLLSP